MARIAVAGFQHETNTFASTPATFADFETPDAWPGLIMGDEIPKAVAGMNLPIAGALAALRTDGHEAVPILWTAAGPSGAVTEDAYARIVGMIREGLGRSGSLDGVYLDLHGAMVAEGADDGDGETLARLRAAIGDTPLVASLDLHANPSDRLVAIADGLVAYRTYPHLDMAETGARAARHLIRCLEQGRPTHRLHRLPFLIPLPWQCTETAPADRLYRRLAELETGAGLCLSFAMGFPPADVAHCGPAVFAYGWDQDRVEAAVAALAADIEAAEGAFAGRLWEPTDAVAHAIDRSQTSTRPIILADTQDNPGGGAESDGTVLLAELLRQGAEGAAVGLLYDPEAAAAATRVGAGGTITCDLGGRSSGNTPVSGTFRVEAVGDGAIAATGPFYQGSRMQLGPMARLRADGVQVIVSSRKQQAADQAMFRQLGLEPTTAKILVVKSSVHFRADFAPIAEEILVVRAPGANIADPAELPYRKLRDGLRLSPGGTAFLRS
ncbi:MAG: M81 family metallopeptidase [Alphaproteobacteria bacterium]|nr:M81 family metallopeptidase [Alphaproteobacteria bacterium]